MISFFIFFTKFSWYKMPTNFVWLLPFSKYKGVEMGSTSKNKPNFDRVFFLPSSNGFWDIMSQRELNDTNAEKFVSCMSQQICCSSDSFRDMIGSIVTNSQHFLFSFYVWFYVFYLFSFNIPITTFHAVPGIALYLDRHGEICFGLKKEYR